MSTAKDKTRITQWGNSKATRIPSHVVKQLDLKDNQSLKVTVKNDSIVLTSERKHPTNIHKLFEGWTDDRKNNHELDWGEAKGNKFKW